MILCRYIELEFNSDCKCISNVDVDCSGYNDVIDLGSRHGDYYVDIGIFSEVAGAPYWFQGIGDVNADSKQAPVIGRSGRIVKWKGRKRPGG